MRSWTRAMGVGMSLFASELRRSAFGNAGGRVVRVDPCDGATGVFRDSLVVLHLSSAVDPQTLSVLTFIVRDPEGPVPGSARLSPDGHVVLFRPERCLRPDLLHFVVASGLRDTRGNEIECHLSRFIPCDLALEDLNA